MCLDSVQERSGELAYKVMVGDCVAEARRLFTQVAHNEEANVARWRGGARVRLSRSDYAVYGVEMF